jgi:prepilin-type N-terminal cleavage/methylation domain-containing protein
MKRRRGFTLIELMVAMVVGLAAITSVYSLGAAMSKQFYEEQRLATTQGTSRVAIMELRRDISRAGLFGTPNGNLEPTCDPSPPELPLLTGGNGPMGAFQYYRDADTAVLDPDSNNPGAHADRLRVLTSLYLTDQLLVHSTSIAGDVVVLQSGNQAYRRTFAWGQTADDFTAGSPPDYLEGDLGWDSAWAGETASWKGIAQKGARAFQTGSVLHIETPEGRHFFRSVFGKRGNTQNEVRIEIDPDLPVGTACMPGAAEGAMVAPLQWVEYAVVDPTAVSSDFYKFEGMFFIDVSDTASPVQALKTQDADDLRESPNRILVRRILDSSDGTVRNHTTQVLAEFVTHFEVSFLMDNKANPTDAPSLAIEPRNTAQAAVNARPEDVRAVIIRLGVRNPLEDRSVQYLADGGTRFEVDDTQKGAARVRMMEIEIPVMNVARRNL